MDAKEAYMHPMSAILSNGVQRVKEYIQDLVQLDQRQGTVSVTKCSNKAIFSYRVHDIVLYHNFRCSYIYNFCSIPCTVTVETGAKDGGYIHHLILCRGWLWKRSATTSAMSSIQYRKRFFELSNMALTYTQNEKQTGVSV